MIRITQLKLPVEHSPEALKKKAAKLLRIVPEEIEKVVICRQSLDARKKPELFYSYTVDVQVAPGKREENLVHKAKSNQVSISKEKPYEFPQSGDESLGGRPVIIGAGPAGLFCGLMLARAGYKPVILERGDDVDARQEKVEKFWETGVLDPSSNVQFGEGGAGTFSDGKLNTLVKDSSGRNHLVLKIFCEFGADPAILYEQKPHIGTDVLSGIVKRMREEIIRLGGEVHFRCQMTGLLVKDGAVCGVQTADGKTIETKAVVLAIGHSARDTFEMLYQTGIPMEAKSFAVGLRIQHPQSVINESQYGRKEAGNLGPASYKVTAQTTSGRGVYSFCMCPGGYVVNASSESSRLAVNGMSYHDRAGENANSALIVTVGPEDYPDQSPLGGVAFQRELERRAFESAGGKIPVQLYEDFRENRLSEKTGRVTPAMRGQWAFADVRAIMPEALNQALLEAMERFGHMIHGFDMLDAVFAGIESRTSSPVRIHRNEKFESEISGLYPCGEGAGYAGGITSAGMDGVKVAEAIAHRFSAG